MAFGQELHGRRHSPWLMSDKLANFLGLNFSKKPTSKYTQYRTYGYVGYVPCPTQLIFLLFRESYTIGVDTVQ
jgi:hypothetical protein